MRELCGEPMVVCRHESRTCTATSLMMLSDAPRPLLLVCSHTTAYKTFQGQSRPLLIPPSGHNLTNTPSYYLFWFGVRTGSQKSLAQENLHPNLLVQSSGSRFKPRFWTELRQP